MADERNTDDDRIVLMAEAIRHRFGVTALAIAERQHALADPGTPVAETWRRIAGILRPV